MTTPAPVKASAIISPRGNIMCSTIRDAHDPEFAWAAYGADTDAKIKELEAIGYRCIRVTVTPEGGKR